MKLTLNVSERINLIGILPQEANLVEQVLFKDLMDKISLNKKEIEDWEVKTEISKGISYSTWNTNKVKDVEFDIDKATIKVLKNRIDELDKAKKISQGSLSVCLKIQELKLEDSQVEEK